MMYDVISRFEKIISVCKEDGCDFVDLTFEDAEQILVLLKEQPKIVRCIDCKYYDYFNGCMSWHDVNSNNDNWYCADGVARDTNVPNKKGR